MAVINNLASKILGLSIIGLSPLASAADLAAFCSLKDGDKNAKIQGENVNELLPIASVSKIVTTHFSILKGSTEYRYSTRIFVTPTINNAVDLHIMGSRDPYFGRDSLHFLLAHLQMRGVSKIRNFTYDENFKFRWAPQSGDVAIGHYDNNDPKPEMVRVELLSRGSLHAEYLQSRTNASKVGIQLPPQLKLSVEKVGFLPASRFTASQNTQQYLQRSSPLKQLLKEMNRNSNNHAANQIFESFGGAERFAESIRERLSLTSNEIKMLNGSGDRVDLENGFTYNKATCSAILHILRDLRLLLKAEGLDLADVMAVAGVDNTSTTGRLYGNDVTAGSLIAKTGTVNPATTLAGLVTTNNGDYFFMYNMATEGRTAAEIREDWRDARAIIRQKITNFIREEKGGRPIKYKSIQFFEIDPLSALQEIPLASSGGQ